MHKHCLWFQVSGFDDYNFAEGQPVRLIKRIDRYSQKGWSGDVIPYLVEIDGDIYDQSIE